MQKIVEYAGFRYELHLNKDGKAVGADPIAGQHKAANKDKHRRAAIQIYNED